MEQKRSFRTWDSYSDHQLHGFAKHQVRTTQGDGCRPSPAGTTHGDEKENSYRLMVWGSHDAELLEETWMHQTAVHRTADLGLVQMGGMIQTFSRIGLESASGLPIFSYKKQREIRGDGDGDAEGDEVTT